jgi:hypothetical protein
LRLGAPPSVAKPAFLAVPAVVGCTNLDGGIIPWPQQAAVWCLAMSERPTHGCWMHTPFHGLLLPKLCACNVSMDGTLGQVARQCKGCATAERTLLVDDTDCGMLQWRAGYDRCMSWVFVGCHSHSLSYCTGWGRDKRVVITILLLLITKPMCRSAPRSDVKRAAVAVLVWCRTSTVVRLTI